MPLLMLRERVAAQAEVAGELALPFELRRRSRLLTRLVDGRSVGLMLDRGAPLKDGECLRGDDGRAYRVRACDEAVMDVHCDDPLTSPASPTTSATGTPRCRSDRGSCALHATTCSPRWCRGWVRSSSRATRRSHRKPVPMRQARIRTAPTASTRR